MIAKMGGAETVLRERSSVGGRGRGGLLRHLKNVIPSITNRKKRA